jgi:hypothetical protein
MKVLSFCLFGEAHKYTAGIVRNCQLAKRFYPEWKVYVVADNTVPEKTLDAVREEGGVVVPPDPSLRNKYLWRLLPSRLPGVSHISFRDADSRLLWRDKTAVAEWVASGKSVHMMQEWEHIPLPMAGMWGLRPAFMPDLVDRAIAAQTNTVWGEDEQFLRKLFPEFAKDVLIHSDYGYTPFTTPRVWDECVGQTFDENVVGGEYSDPSEVPPREVKLDLIW